MTRKEFIDKLLKLGDDNTEVKILAGHVFYEPFEIELSENGDEIRIA